MDNSNLIENISFSIFGDEDDEDDESGSFVKLFPLRGNI